MTNTYQRLAAALLQTQAALLMALYDKPQTFDELIAAGHSQPTLDALWTAEAVTINSQDRYYLTGRGLEIRRYLHN